MKTIKSQPNCTFLCSMNMPSRLQPLEWLLNQFSHSLLTILSLPFCSGTSEVFDYYKVRLTQGPMCWECPTGTSNSSCLDLNLLPFPSKLALLSVFPIWVSGTMIHPVKQAQTRNHLQKSLPSPSYLVMPTHSSR